MYFNALPLSIALSLVSCLALSAKAQDGDGSDGGSDSNFLQDYLTFLNSSGYTSLSSALQRVQNDDDDDDDDNDWLDDLSDGNWTVFVPTNQAFENLPSGVANNVSALSSYLSYHVVYGNFVNSTNSSSGGGCGGASSTSSASQSSSSATASAYRLSEMFMKPSLLQVSETAGDVGVFPNDTVGRTLLTDDDYVQLEGDGDRGQVLAWARLTPGGDIHILNQGVNTTVGNTTQWRNLLIAPVNNIFIPPGNIYNALQSVNDTPLIAFADSIQVPDYDDDDDDDDGNTTTTTFQSASATFTTTISGGSGDGDDDDDDDGNNPTNITALQAIENLEGFTLFAPAPEAFTSDVNNTIQGLQNSNNQPALLALLQNHYVNGSTFYGPTLRELAANGTSDSSANSTLVSAGGQYFSFSQNSTGLYVSNGNGTLARVVRPDLLVENGVVHVIDRVLINENANPSAASSAISSYSQQATQTATDTVVEGDLPIPTDSTASYTQTWTATSTTDSDDLVETQGATFRFYRRV